MWLRVLILSSSTYLIEPVVFVTGVCERGINIHGSEGEERVGTWLSSTSVVGQGQTINERWKKLHEWSHEEQLCFNNSLFSFRSALLLNDIRNRDNRIHQVSALSINYMCIPRVENFSSKLTILKRKTSRVNFILVSGMVDFRDQWESTHHYSSGLTEVTIVGLWIWTTTMVDGGPMIFIQTAASNIMMKWVRILHHSRTFNRFILKSSRSSKFIALVVYCWVLEAIYEPQQVNAASRRLAFTSFSTDWPKSETSCGWLWGHYAVGSKFGRGGVAGASERRKSLRKLVLQTAKVSS